MTTLVRINRATVRRNPRAGATSTPAQLEPSSTQLVVRRDGILYTLVSHGESRGECGKLVGDFICIEAGSLCDPSLLDGPRRWEIEQHEMVAIECMSGMGLIHHEPEPTWLFEYLPTPVTCEGCGEAFDVSELQSDSRSWNTDGECGEAWSNEVCPKCGRWYCCSVEYEGLVAAV
jgi:hypothetical protein